VNPNAELIRSQYDEVNATWSRARVVRLMDLMQTDISGIAATINMDIGKLKRQVSTNKLAGEVKLHLHNLETSVLNQRIHPDNG
jgi:hypothetical protein